MRAEAVDNRRHCCLVPMAKGAAIGAASGFVLKYAQGLTPQEKNNPEYVKVITKINNEKTAYNVQTENFLKEMRAKKDLTLAEDTFVKMFDGMKEGNHVSKSTIRKAIVSLSEKGDANVAQFKRICKDSVARANETAQRCIKSYDFLTKHARPTAFFLISGAVIGSIIALINDILSFDVKN